MAELLGLSGDRGDVGRSIARGAPYVFLRVVDHLRPASGAAPGLWHNGPVLALLLATLAATPASADYRMTVRGAAVGSVHLELRPAESGELRLLYRSRTLIRRGPVLAETATLVEARLGADLHLLEMQSERQEGGILVSRAGRGGGGFGASIPTALAPAALVGADRRCLPVIDELTGEQGEACGKSVGKLVEGVLLGQRFRAAMDGPLPLRLELPDSATVFERSTGPVALLAPPDLFGAAVATQGSIPAGADSIALELIAGGPIDLPSSASQRAAHSEKGAAIQWLRAAPEGDAPRRPQKRMGAPLDAVAREACAEIPDSWQASRELAQRVFERIADKASSEQARSPEMSWKSQRGDCSSHVALFLALAERCGIEARRAQGLVMAEGRFWGHVWAQVKIGSAWYDVDPTEGEAPARSPRILFGAGSEEAKAGKLFARSHELSVQVAP